MQLESTGIVYPAISGHPDIFICDTGSGLVVSPNIPEEYLEVILQRKINVRIGEKPLGFEYPATSYYNAVVTEKYLVHNLKYTDTNILDECHDKIHLHTNQAYTRCNLIPLGENNFITSDKNIEKVLLKEKQNVLYTSPEYIILPGFPHGFFGGCCGVFMKKLFIAGNMKYYKSKDIVIEFAKSCGMEIIELYDGRLFDAGGIFFIS